MLVADVGGFSAGPYRIVIHTTPGLHVAERILGGAAVRACRAPTEPVVVPIRMWEQGTATLSTRVPGLALERGPRGSKASPSCCTRASPGRSTRSPGVVNDRVACGVIGAMPTLF